MIAQALVSLRPTAQWILKDDEIEWLDTEQVQPTDKEIQAEIVRLKAQAVVDEKTRLDAQQAQAVAKQSALNKLMALGLTEEEALALGVK